MNRPARTLWGLAAVGGATAVGITTHDAGFVLITLLGGLALPRILGLGGRRGWMFAGCGGRQSARARFEERMGSWHRHAHEDTPAGSAV
jgi:hypothetical protein